MMVMLGSSKVGNDKEVFSDVASVNLAGGVFVAIDSDGKYKKVNASTDKVVGFVIAPGVGIGGNEAEVVDAKTSTDKPYLQYVKKAGSMFSYVKRGNEKYVELGADVDKDDPIYLNPSNGLVCGDASHTEGEGGDATTVNHIRIGNSVFNAAGVAGDIITISFDLL